MDGCVGKRSIGRRAEATEEASDHEPCSFSIGKSRRPATATGPMLTPLLRVVPHAAIENGEREGVSWSASLQLSIVFGLNTCFFPLMDRSKLD